MIVDLARAVLTTTGTPADGAHEPWQDSLPLLVERYLLEHLGEPSLSVGQVAAAHFVSVRQVYYAWSSRHEEDVAEWVMSRRLERAARQLHSGADPIAAVAHRCGFADASHFSRRFRARFGVSPRQWRASSRAEGRP